MFKFPKSFLLSFFFSLILFHTNIHSSIIITPDLAYVIPNTPATFTINNFPRIAVAKKVNKVDLKYEFIPLSIKINQL